MAAAASMAAIAGTAAAATKENGAGSHGSMAIAAVPVSLDRQRGEATV